MKYLNLITITRLLSPWASALAIGAVVQAQVSVPGDFPTPQAAVNASAAGSTIIINGGTWGPLTIDKALTIIGEPSAKFEAALGPNFHYRGVDPAIFLKGPGSGQVTLVNLIASATFKNFLPVSQSIGSVSPGITGSGFDALHVIDCSISGVEWEQSILTGTGGGEPGIKFNNFRNPPIDIWIQNSHVRASMFADDAYVDGFPFEGARAVETLGDVVVLNSTIMGGTTLPILTNYPTCDVVGGPAVVCDELYESESLLQVGTSIFVTDVATGDVCQAPPGPNVIANSHTISGIRLSAEGQARIGQEVSLRWSLPFNDNRATLYVATGLAPRSMTSEGPLFIDPSAVFQRVYIDGITGITTLSIPLDPNLIGFEAGLQILVRGGAGLSSPLALVVRP